MKLLVILSLVAYAVAGGKHDIMSHPNWRLVDRTECGFVKIMPRIINGEPTKIGRFPWLVQVLQRGIEGKDRVVDKYICSGALISKQYVVTAAHCVAEKEKFIKFIRIGESANANIVCTDDCTSRKIKIEKITVHEGYDKTNYINDIALIRLDEQLYYNANVGPICLPADDLLHSQYLGEKFQIAGWGLDSSENLSQMLKFVTLPIRDRCLCEKYYNQSIDEKRLCIGVNSGEDTCQGDSGSPVVWARQENSFIRHYIIGITSFGNEDCGEAPAIYTNLNQYVKWILDHLFGSEYEVLLWEAQQIKENATHTKPEPKPEIKPQPIPKPQPEDINEISPSSESVEEIAYQ